MTAHSSTHMNIYTHTHIQTPHTQSAILSRSNTCIYYGHSPFVTHNYRAWSASCESGRFRAAYSEYFRRLAGRCFVSVRFF